MNEEINNKLKKAKIKKEAYRVKRAKELKFFEEDVCPKCGSNNIDTAGDRYGLHAGDVLDEGAYVCLDCLYELDKEFYYPPREINQLQSDKRRYVTIYIMLGLIAVGIVAFILHSCGVI